MGKGFGKPALIYGVAFCIVLVLDLLTKSLAEAFLSHKILSLLPFLHLVLVYNKGAAFGLLSGAPDIVRLPILILTPVIALVITFLYAVRSKSSYLAFLMGMVGGGAMGNLYDRVFLGQVRDFIYLSYGNLYWPAFNIADASISVAIALFLLKGLFERSGKG